MIKGERIYCLGAGRERMAYDIRITRHGMLPNKAIRVISIDRPRKMWRVNGFTGSTPPYYNFPH